MTPDLVLTADVAGLDGVSVAFPRRAALALRGVDLRIAPGEHVLVTGPSGSGKSTLLAVLSGVVPHTVASRVEGTVEIGGRDAAEADVVSLSRTVGVLAQDPASSLCLSRVDDEIALPLENRAVPRQLISELVDDALLRVGASSLRESGTDRLSGGEAQRVALAAALVAEPALLVLDEPTSMLDAPGVSAVRSALAASTASDDTSTGPAVVLVEHRLDEFAGEAGLRGLPPRTIVLDATGSVTHDGPTSTVLVDSARELARAGCWLPLEAELFALVGETGGLASRAVQDRLLPLAAAAVRDAEAQAPAGVDVGAGVDVEPRSDCRALVLRARHLDVVRDGGQVVVGDVSLDLHVGEVVALLGRNGAGKSSLLLALAGLSPAPLGDDRRRRLGRRRREPAPAPVRGPRPGLVFQDPEHQFVASTVRAELAAGVGTERERRTEELLDRFRLRHLADRDPHRLSGGEKRRVSVAAMLAHDRPVLLADEPTWGLDRAATDDFVRVARHEASNGRALVVASHDVRTVARVADRVVVLDDGRIAADGPLVEVLRDRQLLHRAGVHVPAVVEWVLAEIAAPGGDALAAGTPEAEAVVPRTATDGAALVRALLAVFDVPASAGGPA